MTKQTIDGIAEKEYAVQKKLKTTEVDLKELTYSLKGYFGRFALKIKYAIGLTDPLKELGKIRDDYIEKAIASDQEKIEALDNKINEIDMLLYGINSDGEVIDEYAPRRMIKKTELSVLEYSAELESAQQNTKEGLRKFKTKWLKHELAEASRHYNIYFDEVERAEAFKAEVEIQKEYLLLDKATLEGVSYDLKFLLSLGDPPDIMSIICSSYSNLVSLEHYNNLVEGLEKISSRQRNVVSSLPDFIERKKKKRQEVRLLRRNDEDEIQLAKKRIREEREWINSLVEKYSISQDDIALVHKIKNTQKIMDSPEKSDEARVQAYIDIICMIRSFERSENKSEHNVVSSTTT